MGILKREPAGKIASAEELMAVAHAMEVEAARRYRNFAERMRKRGENELAELFSFLASVEDKHANQVDERARKITGKAPNPTQIRWDLPENFEESDTRSYLLTPYRALAIAVRNEERAFAFYSYLAAGAEDDELRRMAEESALEELDHAARLRRERRKAYREEDRSRISQAAARLPDSLDALLRDAASLEAAAADRHVALAAALERAGKGGNARLFAAAAADERECAESLSARLGAEVPLVHAETPPQTLKEGLQILEFAFEHYSDIVERAKDEEVMKEAQGLAERALARLARVEGSLDNALLEAAQNGMS